MAEEMVDVVDSSDKVVGEAPRKGIHKTGLLHRSAHIFLIDSKGRIWLEKRATTVDTYPGYYSSSAAGHIQKGETYLQGAEREVIEELGITGLKLEEKHKLFASQETSSEFVMFFIARSDAKPRVHEDTEKLELFTVQEIDDMVKKGEHLTPILTALFTWYKANA